MRKNIVYLLVIVILFGNGCHSFRKKFIRTKKYKKEQLVYIDFKDYPETLTREAYVDYYVFVKGWLEELMGALDEGISYKRKKRAINEAVINFEQMTSFFSEEGKVTVDPVYQEMRSIQEQVIKEPNMSSTKNKALMRKTEQCRRRFERELSWSDAEKWLN